MNDAVTVNVGDTVIIYEQRQAPREATVSKVGHTWIEVTPPYG